MYKKITWDNRWIPALVKALQNNSVLIGTSDTVFGLLAATTQVGFDALNSIKGRSEKPYLVLTKSIEHALSLCAHTAHYEQITTCMHAVWPGPVTLLLPAHDSVPTYMKSASSGIGIRVPNHQGLQLLLQQIPYLFSTSANLTTHPIPATIQEIAPDILAQTPYLILEQESSVYATTPSTIIDCAVFPFVIIRPGIISINQLKEKCGDLFISNKS